MNKREFSTDIGGKKLTVAVSDLTENANGAVIVTYGNTSVLATAVMSETERDGIDFFPLTVDYEEKFYAAGQILGSRFVRREGRPTDEAILSGRVVDRTIRPLFDGRLRREIQIVITVLSIDTDDPDILAVNAASLALAISDIPWNGPASAVRIGKSKNERELLINPEYAFRNMPDVELDAVICGKDGIINMIEAAAGEVSDALMKDACETALREIEKLQAFQKSVVREVGKKKRAVAFPEISESTKKLFDEHMREKLPAALMSGAGKDRIHALKDEWRALVEEKLPDENALLAAAYYEDEVNALLHKEAIDGGKRPDGRRMNELRALSAQAGGVSSVLHGTGIFYRGGTHVLSVVTLGGPQDAQIMDGMETKGKKRFMHHYNFPPFSVGETGRLGGTNRRMIGHGALAEKALAPVIPPKDMFPYTIRVVSEVMSSNGSSSMGSVCGGTLALMDAGVPIKAPVAGIAMGLMMESQKYAILTDIQGPEDEHGDMDFKVAGTESGITAVQMDVKVDGVPLSILMEAFAQAEKARHEILDVIRAAIPAPRPDLAPSAPRITIVKSPVEKIGLIIGPGGKMINKIIEETGASIDIEEDGAVFIMGKKDATIAAQMKIEELIHEFEPGEKIEGTVVKIVDFGAFVRLGPQTDGLVHISEMAPWRVERVNDILKEGDIVPIVVKDVDKQSGKISLSIKQRNPDFFKKKWEMKTQKAQESAFCVSMFSCFCACVFLCFCA